MINIIKNNKIKVLIFGIVMLLAFLYTIIMPKAYTIDNEGNIKSDNRFNYLNYNDPYFEQWNNGYKNLYVNNVNNDIRIIIYRDNTNYHNITFYQNNTYNTYNFDFTQYTESGFSIQKVELVFNDSLYDFRIDITNLFTQNELEVNSNYTFYLGYKYVTEDNEWRYEDIYISNKNNTTYEPYGTWYSQENLEIINPWIDNIEYVTYERQTIIDLNNETAPYYISPDNIAYSLLLHANGYTSNTYYEYPMYLEIKFKRPVYMSNYKYIISFNNNGPTGEEETYITFGNTNGPSYSYSFIYEALDYEFQLPSNMYVDEITLKWYNTTDKPCWPEGMTLNEYYLGWSHGLQQGTREGYNNGYNEGYNTGLQSGEDIGYNNGYAKGLEEGANQSNTLYGMIIRSCRYTN